jgi:phenylalanyl-tRNA synthetase beta chain
MRVPLEWLREFIDVAMSVEELSTALTMAGLEVEAVEEAGEDRVLEINVTPNRPDCLSIMGVAREVSAITGEPLRFPEHEVGKEAATAFRVEISDPDYCRRYAGRVIRGVSMGESPEWMRARLEKCGIRAINNVVDVTNYVLLELGHPLHAFDLALLKGALVRVGLAGRGRRITTLDGVDRELPEEALLIWDEKRPVAVAGVMGGAETEVSGETRDVFLESAWFLPESIRRTARRLALRSESSYRFERGTDIEMLVRALDRAALLVSKIAGGAVEEKVDVYPGKFEPEPVMVKYERVNRLLGTDLGAGEMEAILGRLDLEVKGDRDFFTVTPPPYRSDLKRDADVIEEIARLYGYEKIPTEAPVARLEACRRTERLGDVKVALAMEGFSEAVNYSFMNEGHLDLLGIPTEDRRRRAVGIRNPLRKEDALLRTTLLPGLLENLAYNYFRGVRDIRVFEAARVFEDVGEDLPQESLHVGGAYCAEKAPSLWKEAAEPFYLAKGAVEAVLDRLKIRECSFLPCREPFLHPLRSADVCLSGKRAGFVGELSPAVTERLDLKARPHVLVFELDAEILFSALPGETVYEPIPKFPAVERDMAIVVDESARAGDVVALIRGYPTEFIEDVSVFDYYKGPNIPEGKKSLAFGVRYRSRERTLTDEEVEELHRSIVAHVTEKTGGEIRGA